MIVVLAMALAAAPPRPNPETLNRPPVRPRLGYLTAAQLADKCSAATPAETSYCFSYIAAVHDTMRAYEIWLAQREFCPPAEVSQSELRRSFLGYLSAYPSNRGGVAASVVVVALKESYPCVASNAEVVPTPKPQ